MLGRGAVMTVTGEPDRAIVSFNEVIARLPENALAYLLRGRALLVKEDLDGALADFDHALRLLPSYADALAAHSLVLSKKHDLTTALADVDRAIAQQPSVEGYSVRAEIYEARGENDRAIADLRKATEVRPKTIFDFLAQVDAKKHMDDLGKRIPCGTSGRSGVGDSCL
jgi:tetratricopeptide (TPR) repeat protein